MTDKSREEELRIHAMGAAISRREWSEVERAHNAIRDEFHAHQRARPGDGAVRERSLETALRTVLQGYRVIRMAQGMTPDEVSSLPAVQTAEAALTKPASEPADGAVREAAKKALNYIENTESELGITLSCGDALRAALSAPASSSPAEEVER